jgi:hypothetical protein
MEIILFSSSPPLIKPVFEYAIRKIQENHEELELNGIHQLLVYVIDVNTLAANIKTITKNKKLCRKDGLRVR